MFRIPIRTIEGICKSPASIAAIERKTSPFQLSGLRVRARITGNADPAAKGVLTRNRGRTSPTPALTHVNQHPKTKRETRPSTSTMGRLGFSASDLVNHLACMHLTELNHGAAAGQVLGNKVYP